MSRWNTRILVQIHALAEEGKVALTRKAAEEWAELDLEVRPADVAQVLLGLQARDAVKRLRSEHDNAWLYVFRPSLEGLAIYLKVAVREDCVVISFHEYE